MQQNTYNVQPNTYNVQQNTYNEQHNTYNVQHNTYNVQQNTRVLLVRTAWACVLVYVCVCFNRPLIFVQSI